VRVWNPELARRIDGIERPAICSIAIGCGSASARFVAMTSGCAAAEAPHAHRVANRNKQTTAQTGARGAADRFSFNVLTVLWRAHARGAPAPSTR
jgi:hypothetical protein